MSTTDIVQLPYSYNLKLKQGADRSISLTLTDANDVPIDLTNYTSKFVIRSQYGGAVLLELTHIDGITITGALGLIALVITHAKSLLLNFETGVYDWYIASPAGTPVYTYLMEGVVTVTPQVAS